MKKVTRKSLDTLWRIYAALVLEGDEKKVPEMRKALNVLDPFGGVNTGRSKSGRTR